MAEYVLCKKSRLQAIADAVRNKNNTNEKLKIDDIINGIESIEGGGNTDIEDSIITKTLTEYTNSRVSTIGNYAFA